MTLATERSRESCTAKFYSLHGEASGAELLRRTRFKNGQCFKTRRASDQTTDQDSVILKRKFSHLKQRGQETRLLHFSPWWVWGVGPSDLVSRRISLWLLANHWHHRNSLVGCLHHVERRSCSSRALSGTGTRRVFDRSANNWPPVIIHPH